MLKYETLLTMKQLLGLYVLVLLPLNMAQKVTIEDTTS